MNDPGFDRDTLLLLGRLEGKVDSLLAQSSAILNRVEKVELRATSLESWRESLADMADRVEGLERWRTTIVGAMGLLTILGAAVAAFADTIAAKFFH